MSTLFVNLICVLLYLPFPVYSLDTPCAHVTDKNTNVTVTPIQYAHRFYTRIALASKYGYQSSLEDPSTILYATTAAVVKEEIENHLETTRGTFQTNYDVEVVRFLSIASTPSLLTTNLPDDITLQADIIISTSNDGVGPETLETTLLQAAMVSDTERLFYVITSPGKVDVCLREVIHTSQGTLTWNVTEVGINQGTTEKCPVGFERAGELSISVRTCSRDTAGHAAWAQFICTDCGLVTQEGELLQLSEQITSGRENDPDLVIVRKATGLLRNIDEITHVSILAVAEILEALARTGNVSIEVLEEVTTLLSLALDTSTSIIIEAESLYFSSTRINHALRTILGITQMNDRNTITTTSTNVILGIRKLDKDALTFDWYGMRVYSDQSTSGSGSRLQFYDNLTLMYDEDATTSMHFQFGDLPTLGLSDVLLTYIIHPMDKLFQTANESSSRSGPQVITNGWVMSLNLAGVKGQIRSTVTITSRQIIQTVEHPVCGAWNATLNAGHGDWIQDGCQLAEILNGDLAVCQCEMTGTFSLIKDVTAEPLVFPQINVLFFIGPVMAFLGALFCFLVIVAIKKLHKRQFYQIEAAFCLAMAIFYLVFAAGQSAPSLSVGCAVVAGILHFFMLVCACCMIAIAAKFYDTSRCKAVVSKWFALNTLAPAWGVPLVIVCVTVALAPVVYQNSVLGCFPTASNPYALIFALLLPMVACLIGTAVIFLFTNRNVVKQAADTTANQEGTKKPWEWLTTGRIAQMTFIFIICYVTWLFLFSVVYSVVPELQYIFGIFAIVQGVAFPVVSCVLDQDVKYAILAVFRKDPNPDIIPENAPQQFLDDTQQNSTLTRQSFDPMVIPLSDTEQCRISESLDGNGHVNPVAEQSGEDIEMTDQKTLKTRDYSAYEEPVESITPSPMLGKDQTEKENEHIYEEIEMTDQKTLKTRDYSAYEEPVESITPSTMLGKDQTKKENGHSYATQIAQKTLKTQDFSAYEESVGSSTPSTMMGKDRTEKENGHSYATQISPKTQDFSAYEESVGSSTPSTMLGKDRPEKENGHSYATQIAPKTLKTQDFSAYEESVGSSAPSSMLGKDRTEKENGHSYATQIAPKTLKTQDFSAYEESVGSSTPSTMIGKNQTEKENGHSYATQIAPKTLKTQDFSAYEESVGSSTPSTMIGKDQTEKENGHSYATQIAPKTLKTQDFSAYEESVGSSTPSTMLEKDRTEKENRHSYATRIAVEAQIEFS